MKIGILGQGYVGKAMKEVFINYFPDIKYYDKFDDEKSNVKSLDDLVEYSEIIFLCLPTPMHKNGKCDTSIIDNETDTINLLSKNKDLTVVIKSTIPPGTTEKLNKKNDNISIVFNPEFLTELNFLDDFKKQDRIVLGGEISECKKIEKLYKIVFSSVPVIKTTSKNAEMVKYLTNTFLATKVSFSNEMKNICDNLGANFDEVVKISILDKRLGTSHWQVPGHDGNLGFGGSCLPKDINAIIYLCNQLKIDVDLLETVWNNNLKNRPSQDWKKLKGRAIIDS